MSSITFSGLSTGMNTGNMIEQLVSLEGSAIKQMEQRKRDYQSQISIIQKLNSNLQSLQSQSRGLDTLDEFLSYETTTSDSDYVSVSASGTATPGNYNVEVTSMAQTERRYSRDFSAKDEDGLFGTGTLTIQVGDDAENAVTIDIDADDTLERIVGKINAEDIEVSAGILYDGTSYHLQISGTETGAENALTITEAGGVDMALDNTDADVNIYQSAADAVIEMDGFTITSASNEVTTAIPGVTLSLKDETPTDEPVSVTVSPNADAVIGKIQGFVDAYNKVTELIRNENSYNGEAKTEARLAGDSSLRSVQMQLGRMMTSALEDLPGNYQALSQIGIKTGTDGKLSIDKDDLKEAIATDAIGVSQLFGGVSDGTITGQDTVSGIADNLDDLIETFIDFSEGSLTAKINGIKTRISGIDDSIERQEDYLAKYEDKLRAQFTSMELMVSDLMSQGNFLSSAGF